MIEIIRDQKAGGYWFPRKLALISESDIKSSLPKSINTNADVSNIWATAVIIVYLTRLFPNQKDNWDLVIEKARKWIKQEEKKIGVSFDWESEATSFLLKISSSF